MKLTESFQTNLHLRHNHLQVRPCSAPINHRHRLQLILLMPTRLNSLHVLAVSLPIPFSKSEIMVQGMTFKIEASSQLSDIIQSNHFNRQGLYNRHLQVRTIVQTCFIASTVLKMGHWHDPQLLKVRRHMAGVQALR